MTMLPSTAMGNPHWDQAQEALRWIWECYDNDKEGDGYDAQAMRDAIASGTCDAIDAMCVLWASGCLWDAVSEFMEDIESAVLGQ